MFVFVLLDDLCNIVRALLEVRWMPVAISLDVGWIFAGCSFDVRYNLLGCSLDVRWIVVGCSLHVRWIFSDAPRFPSIPPSHGAEHLLSKGAEDIFWDALWLGTGPSLCWIGIWGCFRI
jgi:hypothetical protein